MTTFTSRALVALFFAASSLARPQWFGGPGGPPGGPPEGSPPWGPPEEPFGSAVTTATLFTTETVVPTGGAPPAPWTNTQPSEPLTSGTTAIPIQPPGQLSSAVSGVPSPPVGPLSSAVSGISNLPPGPLSSAGASIPGGQPSHNPLPTAVPTGSGTKGFTNSKSKAVGTKNHNPTSARTPSNPTHTPKKTTSDSTSNSNSNSNSESNSGSGDSSLINAVLNSTNYYRSTHEANPVVWNDKLAAFGQNLVEKCVFNHSGGPYGENLAAGYPNPTLAVDAWGDEEQKYDYANPNFTEATGHFTQLVWKNTKEVGCGWYNCPAGAGTATGWFLACEYFPRGNVATHYGQQVGKPGQSSDGQPGLSERSSSNGVSKNVAKAGTWALGWGVAVGSLLSGLRP